MLVGSGAKKIHVCAPSNAAVDEVLSRLSTQGLTGITREREELKKHLLRIGSIDYEPTETVKQHLLDNRLTETLTSEKVYCLKQQIDFAEELLQEMRKGIKLEPQNDRHRVALQKVMQKENLRKIKQFCFKETTSG